MAQSEPRPQDHGLGFRPQLPSLLARWAAVGRRFALRKPLGAFGGVVILLLLGIAVFSDQIAPYDFDELNLQNLLESPSRDHPLGTDHQGRDVLSRVIYGARTSVIIGFGTVGISTFFATLIGVISGYYTGKVDLIVQRLIDIWLAFPGLIFLLFVITILRASPTSVIITLSLLFFAGASRIMRAQVISVKQHDYIVAARALGAADYRILLRHILPNVYAVIIITMSVEVGAVILVESSLSFLGFGIPPPFPSWGRMLQEAQPQMQTHPYLALFPGLAITITVYAFNIFGDALRDVLDPRLRGQ